MSGSRVQPEEWKMGNGEWGMENGEYVDESNRVALGLVSIDRVN